MEIDKFAISNDDKRKNLLEKIGLIKELEKIYPEKKLYDEAREGAVDALYCTYLRCEGKEDKAVEELLSTYEYNNELKSPYWNSLRAVLYMFNATGIYEKAKQNFSQIETKLLEAELKSFYKEQERFETRLKNKLLILSMEKSHN